MIRHIAAFRPSADDLGQRKVDVAGMGDRLAPFARTFAGVLDMRVHSALGLVDSHRHAVLVSGHSGNAALETNQTHPDQMAGR
jgi:hypothetical protein